MGNSEDRNQNTEPMDSSKSIPDTGAQKSDESSKSPDSSNPTGKYPIIKLLKDSGKKTISKVMTSLIIVKDKFINTVKTFIEWMSKHCPVGINLLPLMLCYFFLYAVIRCLFANESILESISAIKPLFQSRKVTAIFSLGVLIGLTLLYKWNAYLKLMSDASDQKNEVGNKQSSLYHSWDNKWDNQNNQSYNVFFELYKETYELTKKKQESNRYGNIFWKGIFILTLFSALAVFVWMIFARKEEALSAMLVDRGVFLLVLTLGAGIVAKWLDVKRYQETWSRHSKTLHRMNMEMLAFVSELPPYQIYNNPRKRFIERISIIWNDNQIQFSENMEGKEMELMDAVTRLSPSKNKEKD